MDRLAGSAEGWTFWTRHLLKLDERWKKDVVVERQAERPENLAWVQQGVLMIGVNMVGGNMKDAAEWHARHLACAAWVKENLAKHGAAARATVIFAQEQAKGTAGRFLRDSCGRSEDLCEAGYVPARRRPQIRSRTELARAEHHPRASGSGRQSAAAVDYGHAGSRSTIFVGPEIAGVIEFEYQIIHHCGGSAGNDSPGQRAFTNPRACHGNQVVKQVPREPVHAQCRGTN